jgi:acetyl-CoA carboxylase biotin carboxyl carrier protein
MDLAYIKKLVKLVAESGVDEIELEEEGKRIRVVKRGAQVAPAVSAVPAPIVEIPVPPNPVLTSPEAAAPAAAVVASATKHHEIKSPIVGTFYRAPAPDAAPFVQVGTEVQSGTVLCIVEAMKLMNEIESDIAGKVVKIMVENGQPVEYDQTLFLLELP